MSSFRWAEGYCRFEQVAFRRVFRPKRDPASPDAPIVTAYTNGDVTLRSNRRTKGYHEATDLSGYQAVRAGDFVVHGLDILRGSVGVSDSDGAITSVCIVCELIGEADARYFAYVIRAQAWSGLPRALARGVREGGADFRRWDTLAALPLPIPEPAAQATIADFLDRETGRIDALVEKKRRLIELLEEKRTALISQVVTRGLDPTVPMKNSGIPWLGALPVHWTVDRVKNVVSAVTSGSRNWAQYYADGGQLFLTVTNVPRKGIAVDLNVRRYVRAPDNAETRRTAVTHGDVLMSITADTGSVAVISTDTPLPAFISQHVASLRPRSGRASSRWLAYRLKAPDAQAQIEAARYGGTKQQLSLPDVQTLRISVPPPTEQLRIATWLDDREEKIVRSTEKLSQQLALLAEHRQALITAAVTGQIDVTASAPEPEEVLG